MKKLLLICSHCLVTAGALFGQSLNITAAGYASSKLFDSTPGFTITGLGADAGGNVFYLETDAAFPAVASTTLYKRSFSESYARATPLFNYGSPLFGAFVVVQNGQVYFGESSTGSIRSINPDGSGLVTLGSVTGAYDLAFSAGNAFVSANPETDFAKPPRNKVYRFDLGTGVADAILDTGGDYSGPIDFDGAGDLLYGGSGVVSVRDLHAFSPAEVASAFGPTELALAPPSHRLIANGKNVYLAFAGGTSLWKDDFQTLTRHDLSDLRSETVGTTPNSLGNLDFAADGLFTSVTDFSTGRSSVFEVASIPEPSPHLLVTGAVTFLTLAQRRSGGIAR